MPSTRATSIPLPASSSSTPLRNPATDRVAQSASRPTRSPRASAMTPQPPTHKDISDHHSHISATDEQMLREAEKILSTPTRRRLRSEGAATPVPSSSIASARDRRHAKLNEAREHGDHHEDEASATTTVGRESASDDGTLGTIDVEVDDVIEAAPIGASVSENASDSEDQGDDDEGGDEDTESEGEAGHNEMETRQRGGSSGLKSIGARSVVETNGVIASNSPRAGHPTVDDSVTPAALRQGEVTIQSDKEDGDEDSASDSGSESTQRESASDTDDSDPQTDSSDSDEDSDEESDEEEARLEKLLQAAMISAASAKTPRASSKEDSEGAETGENVLQFDKQAKKAAPIPDLSIPSLPKPHLSFNANGSATASSSASVLPSTSKPKSRKGKEKAVAPELEADDRPYERELSKREKAAQPRKATASELWSTLPAARADALPQMKRDYQALALANSLDPKRFMKGGNKANKVPERFAIGTMVDQPKHLRDTTLTKDTTYRPGQIVQNLIRDEQVGETAKRKYGDLQWKRMENGRGKGWKKRTKW